MYCRSGPIRRQRRTPRSRRDDANVAALGEELGGALDPEPEHRQQVARIRARDDEHAQGSPSGRALTAESSARGIRSGPTSSATRPLLRRDHDPVLSGREPRAPPAERAVRDDVMPAQSHQPEVVSGSVLVVIDERHRTAEQKIDPAPVEVVRKDEEVSVWKRSPDEFHRSRVVLEWQDAVVAVDRSGQSRSRLAEPRRRRLSKRRSPQRSPRWGRRADRCERTRRGSRAS